jgi:rare lipoprotein A
VIRNALAVSLALALAACAAAPKKQAPPSASAKPKPAAHAASTGSPYAPAQEDVSKRDGMVGDLYKPDEPDTVPSDIPDVDRIPEPTPRSEPKSRYGNRSYSVLGKRYRVLESAEGYDETGIASYYGKKFHGRRTSNLEVYDMYAFTAAHKTLPLPSYARVTNLDNGRSIVVRINDRGPFHPGRIIDLSYAAAVKLGYRDQGTARVEVKGLASPDDDASEHDGMLASASAPPPTPALPPATRIATGQPAPTPKPLASTAMDKLVDALPIAGAQAAERAPAEAAATAPVPSAATPANVRELRFDMRQDGRTMTADEFDAWMRTRQVRVATGRSGKPDAVVAAAAAGTSNPPSQAREPAAAPPPPAQIPAGGEVVLQVASFGNEQNAQRALAMLQGARIPGAQLQGADVAGKRVWRLRIGPVAAATAPELAARVAGLGFGQPQRVRE